jgi:2'-5' RNA ligase
MKKWFIGLSIQDLDISTFIEGAPELLNFFHPKDWHITLAFLGRTSEFDRNKAWKYAVNHKPFAQELYLNNWRKMGPVNAPTALALDFKNDNKTKNWMVQHTDNTLKIAKAKPSQYSPLPHFTLARLTSNLNKEQMNQINVWMKHSKVSNTSVFCQDICLYTRADKDYSNKYTIVESEALSHNCGETLCTGHNSEWEKCTTNGF